jgi:hypothetical protein
MSVSVRMPGEFLPSKQLSWNQDGTLVVTVPRTLRCAAFQGSIQQFLHEHHKDRADAYRFPPDMESADAAAFPGMQPAVTRLH